MKARLQTTVDANLLENFKRTAVCKIKKPKGSLQEALEEAMRMWLRSQGVDPDEPSPFFIIQEQLKRLVGG